MLVRALLAPVPVGCPQTAAFAEHLSAKQIAGHALAPVCIAADCASVIKSITYGPGYATDYKRPMGGVWRQVQWGNIGEAIKVRAHASRKEAEEEQWLRHWMGNDTADGLAKRAAKSHRLPMEDLQVLGKERLLQAGVLTAAAKLFSHWKPVDVSSLGRARGAAGPLANGRVRRGGDHHYVWAPHLNMWGCTKCWHFKRADRHRQDRTRCSAAPAWLGRVLPEFGHKLHMVLSEPGEMLPLIFCTRCGAYAGCRVKKLGGKCEGPVGPAYKLFLRTIARGGHPIRRRRTFRRPWPTQLEEPRSEEEEPAIVPLMEAVAPEVQHMEEGMGLDGPGWPQPQQDWTMEEFMEFFGEF